MISFFFYLFIIFKLQLSVGEHLKCQEEEEEEDEEEGEEEEDKSVRHT